MVAGLDPVVQLHLDLQVQEQDLQAPDQPLEPVQDLVVACLDQLVALVAAAYPVQAFRP